MGLYHCNGMLVLEECADETTIRRVVKDSLTKFSLLTVHDFEYRVTMLLILKLYVLLVEYGAIKFF